MDLKSLEEWRPLNHDKICDGYYISSYGNIRFNDTDHSIIQYHSTNGYDYALLRLSTDNDQFKQQLFSIDYLVAITFITKHPKLRNVRAIVKHIDGDTHNNNLSNLECVEDVEEWREVIYKDIIANKYYVSSWGRLKNSDDIIIRGSLDKDGYIRTALSTGNVFRGVAIHQLVANAFIEKPSPDFNVVNHINGDIHDNYWKNLEWTTFKGNSQHASMTGLSLSGEIHKWSRFSEKDITLICKSLVFHNGNVKKVCDDLIHTIPGLNRWVVSVIKCKQSWKNISDQFFSYESFNHIQKHKISEKVVMIICESLVSNKGNIDKTLDEVHDKGFTDVTKNHVAKIKYKRIWTTISDKYFSYDRDNHLFIVSI